MMIVLVSNAWLENVTCGWISVIKYRHGPFDGGVSELADEHDLGSCAVRHRGSSPRFPIPHRLRQSQVAVLMLTAVGATGQLAVGLVDASPGLEE